MRVSGDFKIGLCDFGSAQDFSSINGDDKDIFKYDKYVGKARYVSPELFMAQRKKTGSYNAKLNDIWSLGVCLFIMCVGWHPYNNPTDVDYQFGLIKNGKIEQILMMMNKEQYVTPQIIDLLTRMFKKEDDRIDINEIMQHSFLRNMI